MTAAPLDAPPPAVQMHSLLQHWVRVGPSQQLTICTGKVELGQGISTALVQIACDALGLAPSQVNLVAGHTDLAPDEGYTAGSLSVQHGGAAVLHGQTACGVALVRRKIGVAGDQIHLRRRQAQRIAGDLHQGGRNALPQFNLAGTDRQLLTGSHTHPMLQKGVHLHRRWRGVQRCGGHSLRSLPSRSTAARMALRMRACAPHRQRWRCSACWIWASVGDAVW